MENCPCLWEGRVETAPWGYQIENGLTNGSCESSPEVSVVLGGWPEGAAVERAEKRRSGAETWEPAFRARLAVKRKAR